jgi:hypothetical protein
MLGKTRGCFVENWDNLRGKNDGKRLTKGGRYVILLTVIIPDYI